MLLVRELGSAFGTVNAWGFGGLGVTPLVAATAASTSTAAIAAEKTISAWQPIRPILPAKFLTEAEVKTFHQEWARAVGDQTRILQIGLAPTLPPCPASSLVRDTKYGDYCYHGSVGPDKWPLGTFMAYGVPFHVGEAKDGRFDKAFRPTSDQRHIIEYMVVQTSIQTVYNFWKGIGGTGGKSIKTVISRMPGIRTYLENFRLNPIQPTAAELDGEGGYEQWRARGGYPLYIDVINGKISFPNAIMPEVCISPLCNCTMSEFPGNVSCIRAGVNKDGKAGGGGNGFWVHVAIDQVPNGLFRMALIYDEISKLERFGNAMASIIKGLASVFCAAQPVMQQQMQEMLVERCVNEAKKPCVKGTPKCTCVPPLDSQQIAVGIEATAANAWCKAWAEEDKRPPKFEVEQPPPPPPPAEKKFPWPWVIGGLAVAAGVLYMRRQA